MGDFKASVVAYEVQKSFANKFFSNKTVAKSLIDDTSGNLLDNLYLLLYVFVSSNREIFKKLHTQHLSDQKQERIRENHPKHHQNINQAWDASERRKVQP